MKTPTVDSAALIEILAKDVECRKDNRKLIKAYYKSVYGMTVDEAFSNNYVPNYQTIERYGRLAKAQYEKLRYDKSDEVAKYKDIAMEIIKNDG